MRESTKEKIRKAMIGRFKGYKHSAQSRKHMSEAHKDQIPWNKDKIGVQQHSAETRKKISKTMIGRKLTKEHIKNALRRREMSYPEKKFNEIIKKNNLPYEFVGNGKFFIEKKNPDFINKEKKIAIEVYGKRQKAKFKNNGLDGWIKERQEIFNRNGWTILFIESQSIIEESLLEIL